MSTDPGVEPATGPDDATSAPRARGSPAPAIFVGTMVAAIAVFGPALALLTGVGRVEPEPEPTSPPPIATTRPAATAAAATGAQRTPASADAPLRVVSTSGSATPQSGGGYQVTFIWVLEGAREGDPIKVQFYAGTRLLAEREGALDPQIYTFSTGTLRIVTTQECSAAGWQADLVGVRGRTPAGETLASAAGVACR